jgi:hypothetical protein
MSSFGPLSLFLLSLFCNHFTLTSFATCFILYASIFVHFIYNFYVSEGTCFSLKEIASRLLLSSLPVPHWPSRLTFTAAEAIARLHFNASAPPLTLQPQIP